MFKRHDGSSNSIDLYVYLDGRKFGFFIFSNIIVIILEYGKEMQIKVQVVRSFGAALLFATGRHRYFASCHLKSARCSH